jgi:N-acetylmuramoyl-L-alanine amidase
MAACPLAVQKPITGASGSYIGGPFKIVHHTTEGGTVQAAFDAFAAHRSDPHFTVDATTIYQHIDTDLGARALRNVPSGLETNRERAIQIEVVGFAHRPKTKPTLRNVGRLCRWLEETHSIPRVWPNGLPKPAINDKDPGRHNRDAATWDTKGGHCGHCHVPENTHWDPAYTADEVAFLMRYDPAHGAFEGSMNFLRSPRRTQGYWKRSRKCPITTTSTER